VQGWSRSRIADRYHTSEFNVRNRLKELARALDLHLKTLPSGRPRET